MSTAEKFWSKTSVSGSCIEWTAWRDRDGYGNFNVSTPGQTRRQRKVRSPRYVYEQAVGAIPNGKVIMHTCDNRACVKLQHLDIGTQRQNSDDREVKGRRVRGVDGRFVNLNGEGT